MELSIGTARRRTAAMAVFVMLWSLVVALPAFAAPPTSSSTLLEGAEVLAGEQQTTFRIEVDYPEQSGLDAVLDPKNTVDVVQIVPPSGVLTELVGATDGWSSFRPKNSQRLFFTGSLSPGSTQVFEFTADVARPDRDIVRSFGVFLSDNSGQSFTESTDNGLETAIRILKVQAISVVGPDGATDGSATTGQDNVDIDVHVANEGAPLAGGPTSITLDTTLNGVAGTATASGPSAYGTTTVFSFTDVTMPSSPGTIDLTADAVAREVEAEAINDLTTPLDLMAALGLTYQSGSLSPQAVIPARVPNAPAYAFEVGLNVTGDVDAALDLASTTLTINESQPDNSFRASLADPSAIQNESSSALLTFEAAQVDMTDGEDYPVDVRVVGTDENGADVDIVPNVTDTVDVDGLLPIVLPTLTGQESHLDDPDAGENNVTTAGRTVTFGGTVEREDGSLCTACTLDSAQLLYRTATGGTTTVDVTDDLSLTSGTISGSSEVTETAANITSVALRVTVSRTRTGSGTSTPVIVDNIDPVFDGGITGQVPDFYGDAEPRRVITVELAESVKFNPSTLVSDWYVDGNTVQDAQAFRADGTETDGHADLVVLTVSSDLDPNQVPQVRYEPGKTTPLDGNRGADQVQRDLADAPIDIVDGIVPALPSLLEVNDRIEQDDAFWSNTSSPSFTFTGVAAGDLVKLYEVGDGGTRIPIGQATSDGGDVVINGDGSYTFTGLAADHDSRTVAAEVLDPNDNSSGLAEFTVEFDFVAPTLSSWSKTGRDVTVTLSEPLTKDPDWVGRNFASDWAAEAGEGFAAQTFAAESVSRDADNGGFGQLLVTFEQDAGTATFDRLIYEFLAELGSGKRYEDRAGNQLADFVDPPSS